MGAAWGHRRLLLKWPLGLVEAGAGSSSPGHHGDLRLSYFYPEVRTVLSLTWAPWADLQAAEETGQGGD